MKKGSAPIPLHKLSERHASGIDLQYISKVSLKGSTTVLEPHRDDHYIFIFQTRGTSTFMVDFETITGTSPSIFCILPGQVHHYIDSTDAEAWFFAIETLQVPEQYRCVFEEELLKIRPVLLTAAEIAHLERTFTALFQLLTEENPAYLSSVVSSLASAAIGLLAGFYKKTVSPEQAGQRSTVITHQFRSLLRRHYLSEKRPAGYASRMHLSLSYLNECVKASTGMPVSYWIRQEIVMEAKRLLFYSSLSVKEIAFHLGFEDHTYFSRLFAAEVQLSPGAFRKAYRG
jgi:AraC family transcriptional regulator, transcriptional activator of pobA